MKSVKYITLGLLVAVATALGAVQPTQAWHIGPLADNSGYCKNQPPNDWKNQLTTRYGFDQTNMDYYVFCSNNSGRDLVYIFAPKLYVLVGSSSGYGYTANFENILARSSDVSTGTARYISQNFYNGQWYDYSTNDSTFSTMTIGGVSYRGMTDFHDYGSSVNPGKKPIFTSAPGSFDLLNPFNVTDFTNYQYSLFTEPYDRAPIIDYSVIEKKGTFTPQKPENISATGIHWLISYGSIEGNPQLETWETTTEINGQEAKQFIFDFPYMAKQNQDNVFGSYSIQAWTVDGNGDRLSFITSMLIVLKENYYNYYEGSCTNGDCETTPISNDAIDTNQQVCNFTDQFPYINFDSCTQSFKNILNKLSFGKIDLRGNIPKTTTECHALNTFDDWLNLPSGYVVCPQFSTEIRDIVTPFVTFLLGIITFTFLLNHGKNGYEQ